MNTFSARKCVAEVLQILASIREQGLPLRAYVSGSAVAATFYSEVAAAKGDPVEADIWDHKWNDVDVFVNRNSLFALVSALSMVGWKIETNPRLVAMLTRQKHMRFHTNSIHLKSPSGYDLNVIFKYVEGSEVDSLYDVLFSFDLCLLGIGFNDNGKFVDLRPAMVEHTPDFTPGGLLTHAGQMTYDFAGQPSGLLPYRDFTYGEGLFSDFSLPRILDRLVKYGIVYGYDIHEAMPRVIQGLKLYAEYKLMRGGDDAQALATVALTSAAALERGDLLAISKSLPKLREEDPWVSYLKSLELNGS